MAAHSAQVRTTIFVIVAATVLAALSALWLRPLREPTAVLDLSGRSVEPLGEALGQPVVLIFTRSDCPISNRYAPDVQSLYEEYAPRGVRFWLVYVDPQESPATIEQHRIDYGYTVPALRDMRHELIAMTAARVTPEAAVFDARGSMAYRGRLDNRYVDYDRKRTVPTQRDVANVLEQLLSGTEVIPPLVRRAVGCPIADLVAADR